MKVRHSRGVTFLAMVSSIGIAVFMFSIAGEPGAGPAGMVGTIAIGYALWNGAHLITGRGSPSGFEVDESDLPQIPDTTPRAPADDFASKLRKLESLKNDGLITEAESERKREEILAERW